MGSVRCFAGIPLPDPVADSVADACEALRSSDPSWREEKWVSVPNLHLTLHFMGSIDEVDLPAMMDALDASVRFERFELPFSGIHAVPGTRHCRMLWATFLDPDGACSSLAESVQRAVIPFGVPMEERGFRPHVTLCRARRPKPVDSSALEAADRVARAHLTKMSVARATLYTSRLSPRGPVYTALRDWHARGE